MKTKYIYISISKTIVLDTIASSKCPIEKKCCSEISTNKNIFKKKGLYFFLYSNHKVCGINLCLNLNMRSRQNVQMTQKNI